MPFFKHSTCNPFSTVKQNLVKARKESRQIHYNHDFLIKKAATKASFVRVEIKVTFCLK